MVYVAFGNQILRQNGSLGAPDVKINDSQEPFFVDLELPLGDQNYYTLAIYDNDVNMAPYVHLFAYNILGGDLMSANFIFRYEPPNPPKDSPIHTYHVEVYRQLGKVEYPQLNLTRHNFPLKKMLNLATKVDKMAFTVGDPPILSRIQIPTIDVPVYTTSPTSPRVSSGIQIPTIIGSQITSIVPTGRGQHNFFVPESNLSEQQKKFCSCILKVGARGTARNKYAVCDHSVGTTTRDCSANYNFLVMPDDLIQEFASAHNIDLPIPYNRQQAINIIYSKKGKK